MAKKKKDKKGKRKKHKRAGRAPRRLDKTMSNVGTGSAKKPAKTQKAKATRARRKPEGPVLRSLSDIYQYFRENTSPVYFISPTAYNLLGIDEWIGSLPVHHLLRQLPRRSLALFSPTHSGPRDFESFESVNSYLLGNKEVIDFIKTQRTRQGALRHVRRGDRGASPTSSASRSRSRLASCARRSTPRS